MTYIVFYNEIIIFILIPIKLYKTIFEQHFLILKTNNIIIQLYNIFSFYHDLNIQGYATIPLLHHIFIEKIKKSV